MRASTANLSGRIDTENQLAQGCRDFSAAYMAVKYLASHIQDHPKTITPRTIDVLAGILELRRFHRQKQVLFLYAEAADAMVLMAGHTQNPVAAPIIPRLLGILGNARGKCLRALSQSMGNLPMPFSAPLCQQFPDTVDDPLEISLDTLIDNFQQISWQGRSLLANNGNRAQMVIKFAVSKANIQELVREIRWMDALNLNNPAPDILLPVPLKIRERILFKIKGSMPQGAPDNILDGTCIAFIPCPGYYDYPNERPDTWSQNRIKAVFFKNAQFLGSLTRMGVFHTALIPLFHNRVQQGRRNDNGSYLWEHGGRLDQWLDSCRYPNFAASGPRDFEHLIPEENSKKMGHYIGEHLLSFILVIGSFFRNKAPQRRGMDENNVPCDTRDLFSPTLFRELVDGVCRAYFKGLVQTPCPQNIDLSPLPLIESLITAMGLDVHMEEILRARDQGDMSDDGFKAFLRERGITGQIMKGKEDLVLNTGPHLGEFNQPISVPLLIEHLFRFSAFCTAHLFLGHSLTED